MGTKIARFCDACAAVDVDMPGELTGPLWGRMIDLCDDHYGEYARELHALVAERGAPVDGTTQKRTYTKRSLPAQTADSTPLVVGTCLLCGVSGLMGKDSMRHHLRDHHNVSQSDLMGGTCPVCGMDGMSRLGVHVSKIHADLGIGTANQAFQWALAHGDPHGVYAARIAPHRAA